MSDLAGYRIKMSAAIKPLMPFSAAGVSQDTRAAGRQDIGTAAAHTMGAIAVHSTRCAQKVMRRMNCAP
jgi:hypothetical protein